MKTAQEFFTERYNAIAQTITYDAKWNNGTGYFDKLVDDPSVKLKAGEFAKFTTNVENNRRVIIVGTPLGNVVIFDRYTDGMTSDRPVFVLNCRSILTRSNLVPHNGITAEGMESLVGDVRYPSITSNIGERLQELYDAMMGNFTNKADAARERARTKLHPQ